jgi:hypothetical protein
MRSVKPMENPKEKHWAKAKLMDYHLVRPTEKDYCLATAMEVAAAPKAASHTGTWAD